MPISLIGVMYKIIAKLLANRLRKVLDKVIGEQQMAFIEGRQLVDGVVIANEVIDEAKRKKKRSFLFKVDFEKAYDKVIWDFLDYMLMRMGFCSTWRGWILECLQSSMVSVLVNGSPSRQFPVSKGLRQGDPLSPFLFLIVVEGLNGLMSSAVEKELYKGVTVGKDAVMVTHLQFADDTIFFGEAIEDNIMMIKSIMRTFELPFGLKINFQKSQLMGISAEDGWVSKMAYRLCCKKGILPFKYLGIPIEGNHKRISMWQPLLDSFKKKLTRWKGRQLSLGVRITLINSVLTSLPVFLMSVYLIPKGTLKDIDRIWKSFLWGGEGERKKINWVNWKKVCMPKDYGGLGVRDLGYFNLSLMGKWWGRLAIKEEGLWRRVIASKYSEGGGHWKDWVRNGAGVSSLWWRDVRGINKVEGENSGWLTEGFRLKIGEGKDVSFGKEKECYQMGSMCNGTWKWNLTWRRKLLEREEEAATELSKLIEGVKISPGQLDEWEWKHSKDSHYSTTSAYSLLTKVPRCSNQERVFRRVWNPILPNKISAFNWQLLLNRLPTKSNLLKRGLGSIMGDGKCNLCQEEEEDATHLARKTEQPNKARSQRNRARKTERNLKPTFFEEPKNPELGSSRNPELGSSRNPDLGSSRNPDLGSSRNPDLGSSRNPDLGSATQHWVGFLAELVWVSRRTKMNKQRPDLGDGRQIWEFQCVAREQAGSIGLEQPENPAAQAAKLGSPRLSSTKKGDAGENDQKPKNPDLERKKKRGREEIEKE
ncbi:hypothetical protein SLEP1_g36277 [Rubroshorea leprosula]|uniref:Reverse transcriptase domain-containing protein n=1 Tax=Rubroshorea leprosula TaxID=152421 RepID=A0AAV5KRG7_9ROSI|nr:hypothetical protein SLEP1_g36277 [Rubroshorea leprosula]